MEPLHIYSEILGMGTKTKHKIQLWFMYTFYMEPQGNFIQIFRHTCILTKSSREVRCGIFRFGIMLVQAKVLGFGTFLTSDLGLGELKPGAGSTSHKRIMGGHLGGQSAVLGTCP